MLTDANVAQCVDDDGGSMDFSGMSIEEIESKIEMATATANDHFAIANECRKALRRLKGEE